MNELDLIETKIRQAKTIAIFGHCLHDGDCYGCQIGLKEAITLKYPDKKGYLPWNWIT